MCRDAPTAARKWAGLATFLLPLAILADTHYVRPSGGTPTPPYTAGWATASTNVQLALNAASSGDTVLLTNGLYTVTTGTELARITNGVRLTSVNGPAVTILDGGDVMGRRVLFVTATATNAVVEQLTIRRGNGNGAAQAGGGICLQAGWVRSCVITNNFANNNGNGGGLYITGGTASNCTIVNNRGWINGGGVLASGGTVIDCRIAGNSSGYNQSYHGGGIYMDNAAALVERCRIESNQSGVGGHGGGVYMSLGTLRNCLLRGNSSGYSGGIYMSGGTVQNCTVSRNITLNNVSGTGIYKTGGSVENTIAWDNTPGSRYTRDRGSCPEIYATGGGSVSYSCSAPAAMGTGNFCREPGFSDPAGNDFHLLPGSPCIDSGTFLGGVAVDLEGSPRPLDGDTVAGAVHDVGAFEAAPRSSGAFRCGFAASTNEGLGSAVVTFRAQPAGANTNITWYGWDLNGDGGYERTGGGLGVVTNTFGPGLHTVVLRLTNTAPASAVCTQALFIRVAPTTLYVSPSGVPAIPYTNWSQAATNLTAALDLATAGTWIRITNGTYGVTSQLVVAKGVLMRGENGASQTLIRRSGAANCRVFLVASPDAVLDGLRIENGQITSGDFSVGAGLYLSAGTVRNCTVATNFATSNGSAGGVYMSGGRLEGCRIVRNRAWIYGGGVYMVGGTVDRCVIATNICAYNPSYSGGGIYQDGGTVRNSLVHGNRGGTVGPGGGIYLNSGTVENSTIAHNWTGTGGGGGIRRVGGTVTNCIVYFNLRDLSPDNYSGSLAAIGYSCAPELTNGAGNLTVDPAFADADTRNYRITAGSPCVDAGRALAAVTNDFEGTARPRDGNGVGGAQYDIGAFERADAGGGPLEVDFTATPQEGLSSVPVVLAATLVGANTNIAWYGWDLDNNGTWDRQGTGLRVVTNTFGAGFHSVKLQATNAVLETSTRTRLNVIHVAPLSVYCAPNGGHVAPYDNWARASTNLATAIQMALGGSTVWLSNGIYLLRETVSLNSGITVRGRDGASNTILRRAIAGELRLAYLNATGAVLDGVTLTNGMMQNGSGAGFSMTAGTVRNCIIRNCDIGANYHGAGGYMTGGRVENCLFRNNRVNLYGGGLYLSGGMVINCRFHWNQAGWMNAGFGGGGIYQNGGTIRNCLITGSKGGTGTTGGGIQLADGILESSTIVGNRGGTGGGGVYRVAGSVTNCIIWDNQIEPGISNNVGGSFAAYWWSCSPDLTNAANSNLTLNPVFERPGSGYGLSHSNGDYRLTLLSPCLNSGVFKTWMKLPGATDLDGVKRVSRVRVDRGAYENLAPVGTLLVIN